MNVTADIPKRGLSNCHPSPVANTGCDCPQTPSGAAQHALLAPSQRKVLPHPHPVGQGGADRAFYVAGAIFQPPPPTCLVCFLTGKEAARVRFERFDGLKDTCLSNPKTTAARLS